MPAYYETLVGAAFAVAGFEIRNAETKATGKPTPEFRARSKKSGKVFEVEAKRKERWTASTADLNSDDFRLEYELGNGSQTAPGRPASELNKQGPRTWRRRQSHEREVGQARLSMPNGASSIWIAASGRFTEHQKYATENQADAIRQYAARRGFEIVPTYADAGKSGLSLEGRDALKRLISDGLLGDARADMGFADSAGAGAGESPL